MNLALGALAAALAVASPPAAEKAPRLEYALPDLRLRCLESCGSVRITDVDLELGEPGGPRAARTRLLVADRFYLGLAVDELTRSLSAANARWDLDLEHQDDRTGLGVEYRGPRLRLGARVEDHSPQTGDGWRFDAEAGLRLGPDLELALTAVDDGRARPAAGPEPTPTSSLALGVSWQRGPRFELSGRLESATVETTGGLELDRRLFGLEALYQARRWRLDGALDIADLEGRFERREASAEMQLEYRVLGHLVGRAEARERYEPDLGSIERSFAAGATYYARRYRFARGGEAARRTAELARRAYALGYNERRDHGLEGRRRLRQRLALGEAGDDLAQAIDHLYRAQVVERNVPLAGVSWRQDRATLDGSRSSERELFIAVPWPRGQGPFPLRHDEAATDFLRVTYVRIKREISSGFSTRGSLLAVDVALRRELVVRFSWDDPAATGLQFALQTQERRRFTAQLAYRQGI